MRTQGEDDAKTRFRISLTSSEKTDSQIYRLKENRPKHGTGKFYFVK